MRGFQTQLRGHWFIGDDDGNGQAVSNPPTVKALQVSSIYSKTVWPTGDWALRPFRYTNRSKRDPCFCSTAQSWRSRCLRHSFMNWSGCPEGHRSDRIADLRLCQTTKLAPEAAIRTMIIDMPSMSISQKHTINATINRAAFASLQSACPLRRGTAGPAAQLSNHSEEPILEATQQRQGQPLAVVPNRHWT